MFCTEYVTQLWRNEHARLDAFWHALATCSFSECGVIVTGLQQAAESRAKDFPATTPDGVVNDHFVLTAALQMLGNYYLFWQKICTEQFAESWTKLQDIQDGLRTLFRFSSHRNVLFAAFIEHQCGQLESLYPYRVFASVELAYDSLVCSICARDMSDPECPHIAGELYRGHVAHGIVRGINQLQAISFVENPMDKRCVISFPDDKAHFPLVAYLASLLAEGTLDPLRFQGVEKKNVLLSVAELKGIGRNYACPCGSGLKFKKCCLPKGGVERPHYDIVVAPQALVESEAVVGLKAGQITRGAH